MKLIKLAAAALITLSSLAAQAGLMTIDGGANKLVPNSNFFKNDLDPKNYNIGGILKSNHNGSLNLSFEFLGEEAGWTNVFTSLGNSINTETGGSFTYSKNYALGEAIEFIFTTGGAFVDPKTVTNKASLVGPGVILNNDGENYVSFAIALDTTFKGVKYDAILFFDDTGGYKDDDNHDDLVIGIKASVPESSTFVLMLMGLAGLFAARRMKA